MNYAYIRVSTDKQTLENQRFEIEKYCEERGIEIDIWVQETISGTKKLKDRKLGKLLNKMKPRDTLVISEISRLGRSIIDIMNILNFCIERKIAVISKKEGYQFSDNINSKVLAFAFGLAAEIERNLISQRTKEALARKKAQGAKLGRPRGRSPKMTMLSAQKARIKALLRSGVALSKISKSLGVCRSTLKKFINAKLP
ncbi:MAG: master DNA invertase Mpi family serine-type recombinase [Opitutales bacterium]|nr:master DNA invertase Mpi family serine-type recombinase [Opitutales bacterium]